MSLTHYHGYGDEKTCPHCGERIPAICPECGKPTHFEGEVVCLLPGAAVAAFIILIGLKVAGYL